MTPEEIVETWMERMGLLWPGLFVCGVGMAPVHVMLWRMAGSSRAFLVYSALAFGLYAIYTIATYKAWRAWRRRPIQPPEKLRFLVLIVTGFFFLTNLYMAGMVIPYCAWEVVLLSPGIGRAISILVPLACPVIIVFTLLRAPQLNRGIFFSISMPARPMELSELLNPEWVLLAILTTAFAVCLVLIGSYDLLSIAFFAHRAAGRVLSSCRQHWAPI